jgi:hypothetical protein
MQKLAFIRRHRFGVSSSDESGQTMIFVVVGLAVVLLAIVGFAVDYGNVWFRRQHAQSAADAACTAAVMDMLNNVSLGTTSTTGGFTQGTDFDCTSGSTKAPCQYAAFNGYSSAGLVNNSESDLVQVTFPTSLDGNPIPVCPSPIPPGMKVCVPPASMTTNPFVKVRVTSRLKATFFGMLSAANTVDVPAQASCGLVLATSPIPLIVLDPTRADVFHMNGNPAISIYGGPSRSVQVNSVNTAAVNFVGSPSHVDLHQGGPDLTGSNFGATGIQSPVPSTAASCGSSPKICIGTTGGYTAGTRPILDPFATLTAPAIPTNVPPSTPPTVLAGQNGCPALSGSCDVYYPGYYPSGISVTNKFAIFVPGIYYIVGGLNFNSNSCVRPAQGIPGDGSGGTFFYLANGSSVTVVSNSGCNTSSQTTATNFSTTSGTAPYTLGARCDSLSPASPSNLPATLSGSVLLAPCLAPTVTTYCAPNCTINGGTGYGDPLGASDPYGISRGMLFMQNRAFAAAPSFQGGGAFLLSGSMYFHQCRTSGSDIGTGCTTSAYQTRLELAGNSAGSSYILGNIIVDQLDMSGTPDIAMDLSPQALYYIYKASLLQ